MIFGAFYPYVDCLMYQPNLLHTVEGKTDLVQNLEVKIW